MIEVFVWDMALGYFLGFAGYQSVYSVGVLY